MAVDHFNNTYEEGCHFDFQIKGGLYPITRMLQFNAKGKMISNLKIFGTKDADGNFPILTGTKLLKKNGNKIQKILTFIISKTLKKNLNNYLLMEKKEF